MFELFKRAYEKSQIVNIPTLNPCVLSQFLTFVLWTFIPLQVVLFSSFRADEKKQKARHRVSKFAPSSCSYLCIDNTALSHPVRCKLRLHYARLYAGGIVDLQSKFVRFSLVVIILTCQIREWGTRFPRTSIIAISTAQTHPILFLI